MWTRKLVGWMVVVAVILIIIIWIGFSVYFSRHATPELHYTDSDIMLFTPMRHWNHPGFEYEARTIYGLIPEEGYYLARLRRSGKQLEVEEFLMKPQERHTEHIKKTVDLKKPLLNNSVKIDDGPAIEFHDNFEQIKEEWWRFDLDLVDIKLMSERMACLVGPKGFLTVHNDYIMASYAYMDMTAVGTIKERSKESGRREGESDVGGQSDVGGMIEGRSGQGIGVENMKDLKEGSRSTNLEQNSTAQTNHLYSIPPVAHSSTSQPDIYSIPSARSFIGRSQSSAKPRPDTSSISSSMDPADLYSIPTFRTSTGGHLQSSAVKTDLYSIPTSRTSTPAHSQSSAKSPTLYAIPSSNSTNGRSHPQSTSFYAHHFRLSHDWGQIPTDRFKHERYHICLPGSAAMEVYIILYDDIVFAHLICERFNGAKVNIENLIYTDGLWSKAIEDRKGELKITLFPTYIDHKLGVGIYDAEVVYGDSKVKCEAYWETYIL